MVDMDRFEGRCWLDWWANPSTNFGGIEVSVVIMSAKTGWDAHGQLINDAEREALAFLRDMDPVFTLRFRDGSTTQVTLTLTDDRRFTLADYTGQQSQRPVDTGETSRRGPCSLPARRSSRRSTDDHGTSSSGAARVNWDPFRDGHGSAR